MKAMRPHIFIGTGLVVALSCGLMPLSAGAATIPADAFRVTASAVNAASDFAFTQTATPKLAPGQSGDAIVKVTNNRTTKTASGADITFTAPAGSAFTSNTVKIGYDGGVTSVVGTLSADKKTLTLSAPGFVLTPGQWNTFQTSIKTDADSTRSGLISDGSIAFTSGTLSGATTTLAYEADYEAYTFTQTATPKLAPGQSGDAIVKVTNNRTTKTASGADITFTAPAGSAFTSNIVKIGYDGGVTSVVGTLSADKKTLTLSAPGFVLTPGQWNTFQTSLKTDADSTRSGLISDGSIAFTSGTLSGQNTKIAYEADYEAYTLTQTATPKLAPGQSGDAIVKVTNNRTTKTASGADITFTAPAGTTFSSPTVTIGFATGSNPFTGALSADKKTLTLSASGFNLAAGQWNTFRTSLTADADSTRSGLISDGTMTFTSGTLSGQNTKIAYEAQYVAPEPVVLDAPAIGAVVTDTNRPVYSGKGEPGAEITVKGSSGRVVATTTVKADGTWSVPASFDLVNGKYFGTVHQSVDGSSARFEFSLNYQAPKVAIAPVTFTSPTKNEQVLAGKPVFTGKGEPGATITLTGRYGTPLGTGVVKADGTWKIESAVALKVGSYAVIAKQDVDGQRSSAEVEFTTVEPGFVTLTGPALNAELEAGKPVFTGTGTAGAIVVVQGRFGTILGQTTVGDNGEWTVASTVSLVPASYAGIAKQEVNGKVTTAPFQFTIK